MAESINLKRFLDAQDGGTSIDRNRTAYEVALKEIQDGEKTGCIANCDGLKHSALRRHPANRQLRPIY